MNIFKILANGDGTINEANVSAFLGYLLDPNQDHGLGYEFLQRFLELVIDFEQNNATVREFDYNIILESAFKDTQDKNSIVDLTILCFKNISTNKKQSIAVDLMKNERSLEYVFLIENKIRNSSITLGQLEKQYRSTLSEINANDSISIPDEKVYSIYLTPKDKANNQGFSNEFKRLSNIEKEHIFWNEDDNSINEMIKKLIQDESNGQIEAINEYTKHTLISFSRFIENDFKSEIQEKKENKQGLFQKDISSTLDQHLVKYESELSHSTNGFLTKFDTYIPEKNKFEVRHSRTHPISIFIPTIGKIFSLTKYGKKVKLHFITRNYKRDDLTQAMINYFDQKGMKVRAGHFGFDYFTMPSLDETILLFEDYLTIIEQTQEN